MTLEEALEEARQHRIQLVEQYQREADKLAKKMTRAFRTEGIITFNERVAFVMSDVIQIEDENAVR